MVDINNNVNVKVNADSSRFNSAVAKANLSLKSLQTSLKTTSQTFNTISQTAQRAFLGVSAVIGIAAGTFGRFEKGLTNVKTLLSGTDEEIQRVSENLENLAKRTLRDTDKSINDVNRGLFLLVSATSDVTLQQERFKAAVKLSIGGAADLSVAVDSITTAANAYGDELINADKIARTFFVGQKFGKTDVQLLASNIGKVIPVAKLAGFSLQEITSATAQLTLAGLSTEEATTALKNSIKSLLNPLGEEKKLFKSLGLAYGEAGLEGRTFESVLADISKVAQSGGAEIFDLFGNIRAVQAIANLGGRDLDKYRKILNEVETDTTSLNRAVEAQRETFLFALGQIKNSASLLFSELGERLAPKILELGDNIKRFADGIAALSDEDLETLASSLFNLAKGLFVITVASKALSIGFSVGGGLASLGAFALAHPALAAAAVAILAMAFGFKKLVDVTSGAKLEKLANEQNLLNEAIQNTEDTLKGLNKEDEKYEATRKFLLQDLENYKNRLVEIKDELNKLSGKDKGLFEGIFGSVGEISKIFNKINLEFDAFQRKIEEAKPDEGEVFDPSTGRFFSSALMKKVLDEIEEDTKKSTDKIADLFSNLQDTLKSEFESTIDSWLQGMTTFADFIQGLFQDIADAIRQQLAGSIAESLTGFLGGGGLRKTGIGGLIGSFFGPIGTVLGGLFPFANGSLNIPQTMPAMVHQGEMILPRSVAEDIRGRNNNNVDLSSILSSQNDRPINIEMTLGDEQVRIFSKQINVANREIEELNV